MDLKDSGPLGSVLKLYRIPILNIAEMHCLLIIRAIHLICSASYNKNYIFILFMEIETETD